MDYVTKRPACSLAPGYLSPRRLKTAKLVLLAGLCAPFPLNALAAEVGAASESIRLETLTVEGNKLYDMEASEQTEGYNVEAATVGTKTPASLRDIPQSITVLTRDYLDDRQFVTLDDAAKYTPGLRTLTNDSGRSSIFARGYEYDESNINGLPAPMSSIFGTVPSLSAFDRVEIMRGPSGLFNSTSELGGIINLVRKRPTEEFQGHLTGRYGSWDTSMLEADLSGAMNESGSVRGRFVANSSQSNGEVDYNDSEDQTLYGALDIDLSDDTLLSLGVLHQTRDLTPSNGLPSYADGSLLDIDESTFVGADWNNFEGEMTDLFAELTHRFDNGGYGHIALRGSQRDTDFIYAYTGAGVDADGNTSLVGLARDFEQDTYSIDASYSQPFETFGNVSEFVVGGDYKHYDTAYKEARFRGLASINVFDFDPSSVAKPETNYSTNNESEESETGIYSKLTLRPVQDLALIGGARVSWYEGESTTTTLATGAKSTDDQDHDAKITPYAGLVYDLSDNHSLYASYSEVFKPQTEVGSNGDLIDPREGEQYEIGIKGSYYGGLVNSRFTLFRMYDKNRAFEEVPNSGEYVASGETRITGGEIEVSGTLMPGWDVMAGYTYMDTDTLEGDVNSRFIMMPTHQASLWSKYTFYNGELAGLSLGAGVTGMSDFAALSRGVKLEAPGYAVFDAKVGYQITPNLKATLDVNNLFDREYYSRVGSPTTFNFYGPSRSVVAGLRYDF
ncbi:TonB-dependent siderophore receptor [Marinobacterium lutimaris]|uniref:Outer-membrane receptor for ferric coprogen and ferric-rhodotorulic acid n=1 Tax=Marinobacterium lutimaris TaxID=568106 RepID=A0A1H5W4K9_9GAMM|nr:TonB-dependent siderophore receptor [Marinobacterium lutimaris]SEF94313.1 outer-membrane receptor for ferric coprogen and ferric-rhodotorulic acid [Marinobacterium lutimaris]